MDAEPRLIKSAVATSEDGKETILLGLWDDSTFTECRHADGEDISCSSDSGSKIGYLERLMVLSREHFTISITAEDC